MMLTVIILKHFDNNIIKTAKFRHVIAPFPNFIIAESNKICHMNSSHRLCEMDINVKVIQSVMGHSDYQSASDIYTDITDEKKQADFSEIDGRMRLGVRNGVRGC